LHPFAYVAPSTVAEAVAELSKHGDRARPLAGGTDLLVKARANVWELDAVVDIKNIPELMTLTINGSGLSIGAGVPCYQVYDNSEIAAQYPGIVDGASIIGGIQIQSRAGLGGNLCNAAPSGDGIPSLIALAKLLLRISAPAQAERYSKLANFSSASKFLSLPRILALPTHGSSLEMRWTLL
jgi:xanthine dehydrogenase FAD-binding subunit